MQGPKERWVRLTTQSPTEPKQPFPAKAGWLYRIGKTTRPPFARQALLQTALGSRKAREKRQRTPSPQRLEEISRALSCAKDGNGSAPWADVSHQADAASQRHRGQRPARSPGHGPTPLSRNRAGHRLQRRLSRARHLAKNDFNTSVLVRCRCQLIDQSFPLLLSNRFSCQCAQG